MIEPQVEDLEEKTRCYGLLEEAIEEASLLDDFLAENVMAALISVAATVAAKGGMSADDFARALETPAADIRAGKIAFPPYGLLS